MIIRVVLALALVLQISYPALAFTLNGPKWDFAQLYVANTGETLSDSDTVPIRAYNPNTERALLAFTLEKTQALAIEVRTSDDYLVGYLQGKIDGTTYTFNDTSARYFKGYDGLLQELVDDLVADPYPNVDETNFINIIEWDGVVVDGDGIIALENNTLYYIVLRPLHADHATDTVTLAVVVDTDLAPEKAGSSTTGHPFAALWDLPGVHSVNMISGNYSYENTDLQISSAQPLSFTRAYNSSDNYSGILGRNWRTNWDYSLEISALTTRVNMPDGSYYDFRETYSDGITVKYESPDAADMALTLSSGVYTMVAQDKTAYTFNAQGKIQSITTLGGFETQFDYSSGNLVSVTGEFGSFSLSYYGSKVETVTALPSGRSVTYGYSGSDDLISVADYANTTTQYTYDNHRLNGITETPQGAVTRELLALSYDGTGRVGAMYVNGSALANTISYNIETRTTSGADAEGNTFSYTYDRDRNIVRVETYEGIYVYAYESGRRISEQNPDNEITAYEYDIRGNTTLVTKHDGSGTRYEYGDARNNKPTKVTQLGVGGGTISEATYTYDDKGNVTRYVDVKGNATEYTYDNNNNCIKSEDSDGEETTFDYDAMGRLTGIQTPDGASVIREYNDDGKVTKEQTALGFVTKYEYNTSGHLVKITDALEQETRFEVDSKGNVTKQTMPDGAVTVYEYDSNSRLTKEIDPMGRITDYTYDSRGNQLTGTQPYDQGETPVNAVAYAYDGQGRVTGMTDARGNVWTYGYNNYGYQTALDQPIDGGFTATYDSRGNMLTSNDPNGGATRFEYDSIDQVIKSHDPENGERGFLYDANGNVTKITDENGSEWKYSYDSKGNMIAATDPDSNITTYKYDKQNRLVEIKSPRGITQKYTYDADGRVTEYEDGDGIEIKYEYDKLSRLIKASYADGTFVKYEYDAMGRLKAYTDARGNTSAYTYNMAGELIAYRDALGAVTAYEYDLRGNLAKTIDALGNETVYEYDANNNIILMTDSMKGTVKYVYDELDRIASITDAENNLTTYEYDKLGNVTKVTTPDGGVFTYTYDLNNRLTSSSDGTGTTRFAYDDAGNVTSMTDARDKITSFSYDILNRNSGVELPDGGSLSYAYDADGRIVSATVKVSDSESTTTQYTYDGHDRVIGIEDEQGHKRTVTYNAVGQIIKETDENNSTSLYEYDANGNMTKYTDPMGSITQYVYDALDRLISETAPRGGLGEDASVTTYAYDVLGRVTEVTDAMGRKTRLGYDVLGRILTVTDTKGGVTTYGYDANGNITSTKDALGNTAAFKYDTMNRLIEAETAAGQVTQYSYDKRGLVTRIVDPTRGELLSVYDESGNLIQTTDGNGNVTEYEYDPTSRVQSIAYGGMETVRFVYNLAGQLVKLDDSTGITELKYDELGRVESVADPNGRITAYTWDAVGNRASIAAPDGTRTEYTYNENNQLVSATTGSETASYAYYGTTKLRSVTLPNGEATQYAYDTLGNLVSETHSFSGSDIRRYTYKYDEKGRLTSETRDGIGIGLQPMPQETYEYRYDALDRLTQYKGKDGETIDYAYDVSGNLLEEVSNRNGTTVYSYNASNQLTGKTVPDGAQTFTYDGNGNLTSQVSPNGTQTYEYNAANRMVKGTNANGDVSEYVYNGLGYRVENTLTRQNPNLAYQDSGNSPGSGYIGGIEDIIQGWDNNDFYTRIDGSGKVRQDETALEKKSYVPDFTNGGLYDIFISVDGLYEQSLVYGLSLITVEPDAIAGSEPSLQQHIADGQKAYAHQNRLGGNAYFTDVSGAVVSYNEFDAWGAPYTVQPEDANYSGLDVLTGFTGYTYDAVLDVYFAQARLYDFTNRRFSAADPVAGDITVPISLNPYLYCQNDPLNNIDPTGAVMPGDDKLGLTASQVQQIAKHADAYMSAPKGPAGDAARAAAHAAADVIRANAGKTPNYNNTNYAQMAQMMAGLPHVPYMDVVREVAAYSPRMTLDQVMLSADKWMQSAYEKIHPMYPASISSIVSQIRHSDNIYGIIKQNEMDKFEAGGMAPAAYTYLMRLTYASYYTDSKYLQFGLLQAANALRDSGYTKTGVAAIDANIAYMGTIPTKSSSVTLEVHYFRNKLNIEYDWALFSRLNNRLPDNLSWILLPAEDSVYHQAGNPDKDNSKYISADGHFEAVYMPVKNSHGNTISYELQNESNNYEAMGTYNYSGPNTDSYKHIFLDVIPYNIWGNTREDYFNNYRPKKW
jgi:RHS repeat-associated protein